MVFSHEANKALDSIIENRRSVRAFKSEIPGKELIEGIVHAGLWAPYARAAITKEHDFRRFFIIQNGSPILLRISSLIRDQSKISLAQMEKTFSEKPFLREKAKGHLARIKVMAEEGFQELLNAPCLIIISEQKGFPPVEKQSLAHVMENMWLKATALGLGFRLISVIETLSENNDFCELLGTVLGEYAFSGCIVGHAKAESAAGSRPIESEVVRWM